MAGNQKIPTAKDPLVGVISADDETWMGVCSGPECGGGGVPYSTDGWPTKDMATERIQEHYLEHSEGEPMTDLGEFMTERGWERSGDGRTLREITLPEGAADVTPKRKGS